MYVLQMGQTEKMLVKCIQEFFAEHLHCTVQMMKCRILNSVYCLNY
jgi:hypothetical protein